MCSSTDYCCFDSFFVCFILKKLLPQYIQIERSILVPTRMNE